MESTWIWVLPLVVIAAVVATWACCAWMHHSSKPTKKEGFSNAQPSLSLLDLTEFTALPTEFREVLRSSISKLLGALAVKLSDLYVNNPDYVRTTTDQLTNAGIAGIVSFSVPPSVAQAPMSTQSPNQTQTQTPNVQTPPSIRGSIPSMFQTPPTPTPQAPQSLGSSPPVFQPDMAYAPAPSAPQVEPFFGGSF